MKRIMGFVFAMSFMFMCCASVAMAATYYDSVNVGGNTILAAYATNESSYWAASVRVSGAGNGIDVDGNIWKNGKIRKHCSRVMTDSTPLEDSGVGSASLVESQGISANYTVYVSNP